MQKVAGAFLTVMLAAAGVPALALAQGVGLGVSADVEVTAEAETRGNGTAAEMKAEGRSEANVEARTSSAGEAAEEHRSEVAAFVQSLLSVADRDGGVGAELREIAKAQNDAASTTANAMAKVEKRGKIMTFLFGSDYRNLGELRSSLMTAENGIERLNNLRTRASGEVQADLSAQISALEHTKAEIEAFIEARENSFSLFGWLAKRFSN